MANVAVGASSSSSLSSDASQFNSQLSALLDSYRSAEPEDKAKFADQIVRSTSIEFLKIGGAAPKDRLDATRLGCMVFAGTKALIEVDRSEELSQLLTEASQQIAPKSKPAVCYLSLTSAYSHFVAGDFETAAKSLINVGELLSKTKANNFTPYQARYLLSEYSKLLGEVARQFAEAGEGHEKLASSGMELIKRVREWGLNHLHLGAGGYVAVSLWRISKQQEDGSTPVNSSDGDCPAIVYGMRSALTGWERIEGSPLVTMTCAHLFGRYLFSRSRYRAAFFYLDKAQSLADDLRLKVQLGAIIVDQLGVITSSPDEKLRANNAERLVKELENVWKELKRNGAPLNVRSLMAFKYTLISKLAGPNFIPHGEIDELIIESVEQVSSNGISDSLRSILYSIASEDSTRVVRLLTRAHDSFPPTVDAEDGILHLLIEVADYLISLQSLQSVQNQEAVSRLLQLIVSRELAAREVDSDEVATETGVGLPTFFADLVKSARHAFNYPGTLPGEHEEAILTKLLRNVLQSESREAGYLISSHVIGVLVMLNSPQPNWGRITRFAGRVIKRVEPLVEEDPGDVGGISFLSSAYLLKALGHYKQAQNGLARESLRESLQLKIESDLQLDDEKVEGLLADGCRRIDNILRSKKLALLFRRMEIAIHPLDYPSELHDDEEDDEEDYDKDAGEY